MKISSLLFFQSLSFLILSLTSCKHEESDRNRKDLFPAGWEGNAEYFHLENDIIVAGHLDRAIPNNEFLCTEKSYGDFELRLKAKLEGDGKNAGIQFRSSRIQNHFEVIGYQCDMGESEERTIWGSLYDESRRKIFLSHPPEETVSQAFKPGDWNEFLIRAEGKRIQIWLNGVQTVDYLETADNIAEEGIICLQIHSGPPAEARYKDIEIMEL